MAAGGGERRAGCRTTFRGVGRDRPSTCFPPGNCHSSWRTSTTTRRSSTRSACITASPGRTRCGRRSGWRYRARPPVPLGPGRGTGLGAFRAGRSHPLSAKSWRWPAPRGPRPADTPVGPRGPQVRQRPAVPADQPCPPTSRARRPAVPAGQPCPPASRGAAASRFDRRQADPPALAHGDRRHRREECQVIAPDRRAVADASAVHPRNRRSATRRTTSISAGGKPSSAAVAVARTVERNPCASGWPVPGSVASEIDPSSSVSCRPGPGLAFAIPPVSVADGLDGRSRREPPAKLADHLPGHHPA